MQGCLHTTNVASYVMLCIHICYAVKGSINYLSLYIINIFHNLSCDFDWFKLNNMFGKMWVHYKGYLSCLWVFKRSVYSIMFGRHTCIIRGSSLLGSHALMISPGLSMQLSVIPFVLFHYLIHIPGTCICYMQLQPLTRATGPRAQWAIPFPHFLRERDKK